MLIDPMYYIVFFDVDDSKNVSRNKRVFVNEFKNITDGYSEKEIILENNQKYKIVEVRIFNIRNTVDNTIYAVCDIKKIQ